MNLFESLGASKRAATKSAAILGLALSALWLVPAGAQNVGNVNAVNPRSTGTPPGAGERTLVIGNSILHKEVVRTNSAGTAQISFIDKTTLSIGRNSTVTIDKFVYDPQTNAGQLTARFTKGVMRFIGGEVSHNSGAEIVTPVAAIGVRGATLTVIFEKGGGILVIDHFGVINVANDVSQQTILRPGYAVLVTSRTAVIGPPFPVSQQDVDLSIVQTTSAQGQHGGAIHLPTDALAARYGLGEGRLPGDPGMTPGLDTVGIINLGDTFTANRSQQTQYNETVASIPRPQPTTTVTTTTGNGTQTTTTTTTTGTTVTTVTTPGGRRITFTLPPGFFNRFFFGTTAPTIQ